jgi:hypothetical protein
MKLIASYEGWRELPKQRFARIGTQFVAGFGSIEDLYHIKENRLKVKYDIDEIEARIVNGDGAAWVRKLASLPNCDTHYQLDPYHKNRAIKKANLSPAQKDRVWEYLNQKKVEDLLAYLQMLAREAHEANMENGELLQDLYTYFRNNADALVPVVDRKECDRMFGRAALPVVRRLGTMESTVCNVVALRMKHRKASFVRRGAENLARLLCYKRAGELEEKVLSLAAMPGLPVPETGTCVMLRPVQVPQSVGKGKADVFSVNMPIMGSNSAAGKAIRKLLES